MVWTLDNSAGSGSLQPASRIPASAGGVAAFEINVKIKPQTINGTTQYIYAADNLNSLANGCFHLRIRDTDNKLVVHCGPGGSSIASDAALVAGTYYHVRVVAAGMNDTTTDTAQGTLELYINSVKQGSTVTPVNTAFFEANEPIRAIIGHPWRNNNNLFLGLLYEMDWTYDGTTHAWSAAASNRTNTGVQPVFTATSGAIDLVAVSGSSWPTDGSAWTDSAAGADTDAPDWTIDPAVTATSDTGHTFAFTATDASSIIGYGVRLVAGDTVPSAAQVIAGTDGDDNALAANAKWSGSMTSGVSKSATFTGGEVSTTYYYYFAVEDASGNKSVTKTVTATTGAGTISFDSDILVAGVSNGGSYTGIPSISTPITLTDSVGNTLNIAITDNGGGDFDTDDNSETALPTSGSKPGLLFGTVTITGGQ